MLQSLTEMKEKIDSGKQLQNNMWCHFGKVVIDSMDEGSFVRLVGWLVGFFLLGPKAPSLKLQTV